MLFCPDKEMEQHTKIFLRLFGNLGLEEAVLIEDNHTTGTDVFDSDKSNRSVKRKPYTQADETTDKIALNNNHTYS